MGREMTMVRLLPSSLLTNEDEDADAAGADEFGVVHFANTAHLIDMFTKAHIRKYRFRMFTDRYPSLPIYIPV